MSNDNLAPVIVSVVGFEGSALSIAVKASTDLTDNFHEPAFEVVPSQKSLVGSVVLLGLALLL